MHRRTGATTRMPALPMQNLPMAKAGLQKSRGKGRPSSPIPLQFGCRAQSPCLSVTFIPDASGKELPFSFASLQASCIARGGWRSGVFKGGGQDHCIHICMQAHRPVHAPRPINLTTYACLQAHRPVHACRTINLYMLAGPSTCTCLQDHQPDDLFMLAGPLTLQLCAVSWQPCPQRSSRTCWSRWERKCR